MLQVALPDGSVREYSSAVTPLDVAVEISEGLARASVAAEIDGTIVGLHTQLPAEGRLPRGKARNQKQQAKGGEGGWVGLG